jgi:phosphatidylserine decarboxylase
MNGIHKEGNLWIGVSLLLVVSLISGLMYQFGPTHILSLLATVLGLAWMLMLIQFFRIPDRKMKKQPEFVLSPCDGKVVVLEKVFEPEYMKEECWQLSVFMSPLNVHINWYPIDGEVDYYQYHPGKYLVAWHPKSSTENERSSIGISTHSGQKLLVRQVAGVLARKICCYAVQGVRVPQNEEMGFIKFGSRVDLYLPLDTEFRVEIGDVVTGGITRLAKFKTVSIPENESL